MPLRKLSLEFSPFGILMYAFASLTIIACAVTLALLRGGAIALLQGLAYLGLPFLGFFFATMILSAWDDDWLDRKALEHAAALRAQATRCTTCGTALLFDARLDQGWCFRCGVHRMVGETPPPPPP